MELEGREERKGEGEREGHKAKYVSRCDRDPNQCGVTLFTERKERHPASSTHMALANKWPILACAVTR